MISPAESTDHCNFGRVRMLSSKISGFREVGRGQKRTADCRNALSAKLKTAIRAERGDSGRLSRLPHGINVYDSQESNQCSIGSWANTSWDSYITRGENGRLDYDWSGIKSLINIQLNQQSSQYEKLPSWLRSEDSKIGGECR